MPKVDFEIIRQKVRHGEYQVSVHATAYFPDEDRWAQDKIRKK